MKTAHNVIVSKRFTDKMFYTVYIFFGLVGVATTNHYNFRCIEQFLSYMKFHRDDEA